MFLDAVELEHFLMPAIHDEKRHEAIFRSDDHNVFCLQVCVGSAKCLSSCFCQIQSPTLVHDPSLGGYMHVAARAVRTPGTASANQRGETSSGPAANRFLHQTVHNLTTGPCSRSL